MPITVSIVEDDELVRASLAVLISGSGGLQCISQFPSAEAALDLLPKQKPEVVLMDINLPGKSGVECARELKKHLPLTQIIMLTVYEDEDKVFKALAAGATGYLLKRTPPAKLLEAIEEVHRGGSPMSSYIARRIVEYFQAEPVKPAAKPGEVKLTPREQEILHYLSKGYRYKEIGEVLHISLDTVRTHLRRIYEKLQVDSGTEAVAKYLSGK